MICSASTLPLKVPQNGAHVAPFQTARKSAAPLPPALTKEPPA